MRLPIRLTLLVGLLAVALTCADTHGDRALNIPTVDHCALIANPAAYDGKEIRLRGVYSACGKDDSKFFNSSCTGGKTLWVEFDPSYQSCSEPGAVKSLLGMIRKSGARPKPHSSVVLLNYRAANVEFIGRFIASNPYGNEELSPANLPLGPIRPNRAGYDFIFHVSCVERVKPLPKNAKY
jgi:hypothetical protein